MSKGFITLIGAVVCGVVLIAAFVLGVVPLVGEALGVTGQTAQVAQSNEVYETAIAGLQVEGERIDEINASIEGLRRGITADPRLDDVFELVAQAAATSGVVVETITAGDQSAFVIRTEAIPLDEAQPEENTSAPSPDVTPTPSETTAGPTADSPPSTSDAQADGRTQVDFTIRVNATDMGQAVAFLDGLRAGPRLFENIETLVVSTGEIINVDVAGLTFLLPEG